jgi:uncharacterized repeat protein (TIGR01451 family)
VSVTLNVVTTGTYTVAVLSNGPASSGNDYTIDDISIVETTCTADLEITKSVSNATPLVGDIIEYTLNVKNNGPDTATAPIVTDVLPAGMTYEPVGTTHIPSQIVGQNLTWNLADLASGATQILKLRAKVMGIGTLENHVSVNSLSTIDPTSGNNSGSVNILSRTAPVAVDDNYTATGTTPVILIPLTGDSTGTTIQSISGTLLTPGTAQIIPVPNGIVNISTGDIITFTANIGFTGAITIPYVIQDTSGNTATANEIITVSPPSPPTAVDDLYTST